MSVSAAEATRVVLSVLAAKTGYEPDMIEMDMALETELGVDSIKRVEILSDVQKELNVEAQDVAALARTQTVGEVVEAMIKELGGAAPAGGAAAPTPVAAPAAPAATPAAPAAGGASSAQLAAANAQLAQQAQEIASLKAQVTAAASRPAAPAAKPDQRVAIVGYSCILPGGENVNEAWDMIQAGLDCVRDLPNDRVDVTAYYSGSVDHNPVDKIYCTRGGFIPDFEFDPREYNFNMLQMEDTDTNQTLTLLKVKEALEDARINPSGSVKKNIGCVLGIGGGQKSSNEFYSRMNYVVVEKVLRKMGLPEKDVEQAVTKFKAHFPEWR